MSDYWLRVESGFSYVQKAAQILAGDELTMADRELYSKELRDRYIYELIMAIAGSGKELRDVWLLAKS